MGGMQVSTVAPVRSNDEASASLSSSAPAIAASSYGADRITRTPDLSNIVAAHAVTREGMTVAGSPLAFGERFYTPNNHANVKVNGIDSVWKDQKCLGWIYHGSDGLQYFQPDYRYGTKWSAGLDLNEVSGKILNTLGKFNPLKFVHISYEGKTGVGPIVELEGTLKDVQVFKGFASAAPALPNDGMRAPDCTISIGDQIPAGDHGSTRVVDINVIQDRDGITRGFMYLGDDGHRYLQAYNGNGGGFSFGPGMKGLGVDIGDALLGPIERFTGHGLGSGLMHAMPIDAHSRVLFGAEVTG